MKKTLLIIGFLMFFLTSFTFAQTVTTIADVQDTTGGAGGGDSHLNGQVVTVEGVVSAEIWAYGSTYYIQDGTGPWSGIMVNDSGRENAYGDSIRITASVTEYYGMTELTDVTEYVQLDSGKTVQPTEVTTGEIATDSSNAEAYEGVLVRVTDAAISNADLGYGEWEINDGSGGCRVDDAADYYFNPSNYDSVKSITGPLTYAYGDTKILPRLAYDVVETGEYTRIQRVQQVRISDLLTGPTNEFSDRSYLDGDTLKLRGIVTFPTDFSNAGAGIAFQFGEPEGGPWSEIFSYNADSTAYPVLFEGDEIEVTGYTAEYRASGSGGGFTEFFITGVLNILSVGNPLPPVDTLATSVLRVPETAEQWEIVKVAVKDATITNVDPNYGIFSIDDGSGEILISGGGSNLMGDYVVPPLGSIFKSIGGWVVNTNGSYDDSTTFQLAPVRPTDLVLSSGPPQIANVSRNPGIPISSDPVEISADVTTNASINSVAIYYTVDGGDFSTSSMSHGDGDTWKGSIPAQGDGSWIDYYILATDNIGSTSTMPADTSQLMYCYIVRNSGLNIYDVQYTPWSIQDSPFDGAQVSVTGIVTADTGANNNYSAYAIQDSENPWEGLFVFGISENLNRGDEVTVYGQVSDYNPDWHYKWDNNTLILADSFEVVSSGNSVNALAVSSGDLNGESDQAESYEGVLVRISNATLISVNGYDVTFDDGSGTCLVDNDIISSDYFHFNSTDGYIYAFGDTIGEGEIVKEIQGVFTWSFGSYKIEVRDHNDWGIAVGIDPDYRAMPLSYQLKQNYPNPFNPETRIYFEIPQTHDVTILIYNSLGQKVRTLVNKNFTAGQHIVNWNGLSDEGSTVASGVYFYRIKAGDFIESRKMVLIR